jgi:hypothetical protein
VAVWRSVRQRGDTKTRKSRLTLALPLTAIEALREHRRRQVEDQLAAGALWQENGLVFVSTIGTALDASNVRREFRRIFCAEWRSRLEVSGDSERGLEALASKTVIMPP